MTENKRFTIKPQDDLFGVVDNYSPDKVCVINGIRTEIEAEWLCKDMNTLNDENEQLKQQLTYIQNSICEHIKHQKTELGQKALKEIIEDYNEWLLGHKELKE